MRGVTDVAVVERGRNVVSVSRDGSARLWDCGQSSCIGTFTVADNHIINGCCLGVPSTDFSLPAPEVLPGQLCNLSKLSICFVILLYLNCSVNAVLLTFCFCETCGV